MFTDRERLIFKYHDGERDVFADPLRVRRLFAHALDGEPNRYLERIQENAAAEPVAFEAMERVLAATCQAFGLTPFDPATGAGCTEEKILGVLCAFQAWEDQKKTTSATTPVWPPPSGAGRPATTPVGTVSS
jgi:hypothetical protein